MLEPVQCKNQSDPAAPGSKGLDILLSIVGLGLHVVVVLQASLAFE